MQQPFAGNLAWYDRSGAVTDRPSTDRSAIRAAVADVRPAGPHEQDLLLAFDRLVEEWDERAAHQAFVYRAHQAGQLALVGRLYKLVLARIGDEPHALAARKQIATTAMLAGGVSGALVPRDSRRVPPWVFLSGGVSLAWLIFDVATTGAFSWLDAGMAAVALGAIVWVVRARR